jgi:hypothetical protein
MHFRIIQYCPLLPYAKMCYYTNDKSEKNKHFKFRKKYTYKYRIENVNSNQILLLFFICTPIGKYKRM